MGTEIIVKGMGATIWHEMHVIEESLRKMGYDVVVEDEHPAEKEEPLQTLEEWAMSRRDQMKEYILSKGEEWTQEREEDYLKLSKRTVVLKAVHLPWPG